MFISEISILATVSDNSVRYQAIQNGQIVEHNIKRLKVKVKTRIAIVRQNGRTCFVLSCLVFSCRILHLSTVLRCFVLSCLFLSYFAFKHCVEMFCLVLFFLVVFCT